MKISLLILVILSFCISCKKDNPTTPQNDKYESVTTGYQIWMKKNLDVDHYRNGDSIPQITDPTEWANLKTGAWCYYNNDPVMGAIYGKLYNWYAVNDFRGLAPVGWHVPSDSEWTKLSTYLGGEAIAGGKLKETGTAHWNIPNTGATNKSGLSALPGGYRQSNGSYISIGNYCYWWSSAILETQMESHRTLGFNYAGISRINCDKECGLSVRCIKDSI